MILANMVTGSSLYYLLLLVFKPQAEDSNLHLWVISPALCTYAHRWYVYQLLTF